MPTEQSLIDFLARTENVGYAERIAQAFPGVQRTLEQTVLTKIVQRIEGDASDLGWRVVPPTIADPYIVIVPDDCRVEGDEGRLYAALSVQYYKHELFFGITWNKSEPHPAKNCAESLALRKAVETVLPEHDEWWWLAYRQPPEGSDMEKLADGSTLCQHVADVLVSLMRGHREDIVRINEIADSVTNVAP